MSTIPTTEYTNRIDRARALMREQEISCLMVGPGPDLLYMLGAHSRETERLTVLVLPGEGDALLITPMFEVSLLADLPPGIRVRGWTETEEPTSIAADHLNGTPVAATPVIAVSDRLWSVFLLRLQAALPEARFVPSLPVLPELRITKSQAEKQALITAGALTDEVFDEIVQGQLTGRTEMDIATEISARLKDKGLEVPGLPIVAAGANSASPHHFTGGTVVQPGDVVLLDFGGTYSGYYSDITRTVFAGEPPHENSDEARVYRLVAGAQEAAVQAARPGMTCEELDSVARQLLDESGYGEYFTHRLGHGVGLEGHEAPYIVSGNRRELQPGMAFSIEPGLYLPGRFGVRVEDLAILEPDGALRLNNASRDLVSVR